jgi:hypothetical protein
VDCYLVCHPIIIENGINQLEEVCIEVWYRKIRP